MEKVAKQLTKIVEKFGATYTAYAAKVETEARLKKVACDCIAKLTTLHVVEGISDNDTEPIAKNLEKLLCSEEKDFEGLVNTICTDLYNLINKYKE